MNTKKFYITFIVVFVVLEVTNYIIHGVLLAPVYRTEELQKIMRPEAEMQSLSWVMMVADLIWSFFFTFFFVKGYENKGLMEGIRFGIYMGLFVSLVTAYQVYAVQPVPYSMTIQWFIYGFIQMIILGILASLIYKPKAAA